MSSTTAIDAATSAKVLAILASDTELHDPKAPAVYSTRTSSLARLSHQLVERCTASLRSGPKSGFRAGGEDLCGPLADHRPGTLRLGSW